MTKSKPRQMPAWIAFPVFVAGGAAALALLLADDIIRGAIRAFQAGMDERACRALEPQFAEADGDSPA